MTARERWNKRSGRTSSFVTKLRRRAIYLRDRFRCVYCDSDLTGVAPHEMALDHLEPRVNGGHHDPSNLVTACRRCNCSRRDIPWRAFALERGGLEAVRRITNARRRVLNYALARALLGQSSQPSWSELAS